MRLNFYDYEGFTATPNIITSNATLSRDFSALSQLEVADYAHQITTGTPGCSLTVGSLNSVYHVRLIVKIELKNGNLYFLLLLNQFDCKVSILFQRPYLIYLVVYTGCPTDMLTTSE